jgi:hypothetical protein
MDAWMHGCIGKGWGLMSGLFHNPIDCSGLIHQTIFITRLILPGSQHPFPVKVEGSGEISSPEM